jgi:endogenous inhibitor of DNA gyrase (YacG/DUF329 family)
VCGKPRDTAFRPFCSRRCADVDLQRWLAGIHRISGDEQAGDGESESDRSPPRAPDED